jgi:HEAT repeat protein
MAMYAALRTGDTSVLPQVKDLLSQAQERTEPESAIAYELRNVKDSKAVPDLIAVLNSSRIEFTRSYLLSALAENIQDPRAVPTFAANLTDKEPQVRWLALEGMQKMSGSGTCSLREEGANDLDAFRRQVRESESWWERDGRFASGRRGETVEPG